MNQRKRFSTIRKKTPFHQIKRSNKLITVVIRSLYLLKEIYQNCLLLESNSQKH